MKTIYQAENGKTFETEAECLAYEKECEEKRNSFQLIYLTRKNLEKDNITSNFLSIIDSRDYNKAVDFLFYEERIDLIIFKNKKAFYNFSGFGYNHTGYSIRDWLDTDYLKHYEDNEEIIFCHLGFFSGLQDYWYGKEEEPPIFMDKKQINNVIARMKADAEDNERNFERIF